MRTVWPCGANPVPLEHARRREDLDVLTSVDERLGDVEWTPRRRCSSGANAASREFPTHRGWGGDVDLEHGVRHLCSSAPHARSAHRRHVREEVASASSVTQSGSSIADRAGGWHQSTAATAERRPGPGRRCPSVPHGSNSATAAAPRIGRWLAFPSTQSSRLPLVHAPRRRGPPRRAAAARPARRRPGGGRRGAPVSALRSAAEAVAPRGGAGDGRRAAPGLPLPSAEDDPRRDALAAVLDELARTGVPRGRVTVLVADGARAASGAPRARRGCSGPSERGLPGRIVVHDCEAEDLRPARRGGRSPCGSIRRSWTPTSIVTVGAAETVLHGGDAALVDACAPVTIRGAGARSLLEPGSDGSGWRLGARSRRWCAAPALARALARARPPPRDGPLPRVPVGPDVRRRSRRAPRSAAF